MLIRFATADESALLTELARRAKASWGYPQAWLDQWASELTVTRVYIERHMVFVAELEGEVAGFGALERADGRATVAHLWVHPSRQRRGVGRSLFEAMAGHAARAGHDHVEVVSDPNAEPFYRGLGGRRVRWLDASFDDVERRLPVLHVPTRRDAPEEEGGAWL